MVSFYIISEVETQFLFFIINILKHGRESLFLKLILRKFYFDKFPKAIKKINKIPPILS